MATTKSVLRYILGFLFIAAGANHFVAPDFYLPMMPAYLPWHTELVFLSGVAEIVAGVLVVIPATQRIGGWAIIALLIAVYPANINMAVHPEEFSNYGPPAALYIRLPLQLLPVAWAYWYTRKAAA